MKKLVGLISLFLLLYSTTAFAAWTCSESRRVYGKYIVISVACTSDGSAGSYSIDTYLSDTKGTFLYALEVVPGSGATAPDNTFDVDVEDADAFHILDTNANSNTAKTYNLGSATLEHYPLIKDALGLVIADIGTSGDTVTFNIVCVK